MINLVSLISNAQDWRKFRRKEMSALVIEQWEWCNRVRWPC